MRTLAVLALASTALVACSRTEPRATPEPPLAPSAAPTPTPTPTLTLTPTPSESAGVTMRPAQPRDVAWIGALRRAKTFTTFDLHGEAAPVFHWRLLRERRIAGAPKDEEYPGLYERALTLTIRGKAAQTIPLGDHSGSPESSHLTRCRALGYRQPKGEDWSFPDLPNVVASFSVATIQGSSDWLVLDGGGGRLHVLGRHTHDGACPVQVKQGPLEVCADMQWERRFDLLVAEGAGAHANERITIVGASGESDFDCKDSYSGARLIPPRP